jgi:CspA family cold shock protein
MAQGTIARIISDRGFGFVKPDEGGDDVFFHHSSVANGGFDLLREGQAVEFETGRDARSNRPRAENVRPI